MRDAQQIIMSMWSAGYAATDIIQTLFKVSCDYVSLSLFLSDFSSHLLIGDQGPRSLGDIKARASSGDWILAYAHRRGPQHTAAAPGLHRKTACHGSGSGGGTPFVGVAQIFLSALRIARV